MNVVDKEQERIEQEKTPEGKKAKKRKSITTAIGLLVALALIYVPTHHPMFTGTPHIVTVGGFAVEPGKTTVAELGAAGFHITDSSMNQVKFIGNEIVSGYNEVISMFSPVEARTYYYMMNLFKDGDSYASLTVVNESSSEKTLADCKVRSITVYRSHKDALTATLDGVSMDRLTQESLTEVAGEPKKISDSTSSDEKLVVAKWEKGDYAMELSTKEDGSAYSFTSNYEK